MDEKIFQLRTDEGGIINESPQELVTNGVSGRGITKVSFFAHGFPPLRIRLVHLGDGTFTLTLPSPLDGGFREVR